MAVEAAAAAAGTTSTITNYNLRSLELTSTWAVATVCFFLILISILTEYLLHLLVTWFFSKTRRKTLRRALDNIKSELLILGFISLLLSVSEGQVANICIPKRFSQTFLPCHNRAIDSSDNITMEEPKCASQGKLSLLSREGTRELQYLIFALALFHIVSSVLTFSLAMAKMNRWQSWEAETRTFEYQLTNDPRRFQYAHQTLFGKRHLKFWSDHHILRWPACFVRQFYESVSKVDYLTLRHGFVTAHFAEGTNFDFQKYIERALDKDFSVIVGFRWWIWVFSVFFIFFNAHEFYSYLWLPFIPLMMLLLVGTKLQGIITRMCLDSHDKSHIIRGTLLVKPSDHYFWFGRPKLLLHFIHFISFQNSFQIAFFSWTSVKFGLRSCFHSEIHDIVIKIVVSLTVQFLCGYVTLPLYALVAQMGSLMKKTVFTEAVVEGLKRWKAKAKANAKASKRVAAAHLRSPYCYSPRRPLLEAASKLDSAGAAAIDLAPSFRIHAPAPLSLDSGRFNVAGNALVSVCDRDEEKAKGKRVVEERDKSLISSPEISWNLPVSLKEEWGKWPIQDGSISSFIPVARRIQNSQHSPTIIWRKSPDASQSSDSSSDLNFNYFTLRTDAAIRSYPARVGFGAYVKNRNQQCMLTFCDVACCSMDPLLAEASAIVVGVEVVVEAGIQPLMVESDCIGALNLLKEGSYPCSILLNLVEKFRIWCNLELIVGLAYIPRSLNSEAHRLAKSAVDEERSGIWIEGFPDDIV